jgi:hypothetical protein
VRAAVIDDPAEHPGADHLINVQYEIDGGAAAFASASGPARGTMLTQGDRFEGTWVLSLDS